LAVHRWLYHPKSARCFAPFTTCTRPKGRSSGQSGATQGTSGMGTRSKVPAGLFGGTQAPAYCLFRFLNAAQVPADVKSRLRLANPAARLYAARAGGFRGGFRSHRDRSPILPRFSQAAQPRAGAHRGDSPPLRVYVSGAAAVRCSASKCARSRAPQFALHRRIRWGTQEGTLIPLGTLPEVITLGHCSVLQGYSRGTHKGVLTHYRGTQGVRKGTHKGYS
jgi:hypothetical protein